MKRGKRIYNLLPVWAQTVTVNLASARNFKAKYGGVFRGWLEDLAHNEKKSRDEMLHQQQVAVRHLLEYAVEHVPAYKGRSPENLSEWPILEKMTVAAQPEKFFSDEFAPRELIELHTSGTTGTPLTVRLSKECHQIEMAFRWRHKAWAGVPFLSSGAYVSGHPVVPPNQTKPPFWRWDRHEKRLLCSSYHLAPQNLPAYVAAFEKYRPDFIHGYPSSLYLLGGYKPKAVFTASETLLDFQRTAIERAFGAKVFNWYGNTEMTCNIVECVAGNLHYRLDYGVLELLADGTMIVTGLNNRAMPLIRYRVGDRAVAKAGTCPCGCAFPLIERIEGRVEDYIRTPDGRSVGRMDHLFKDTHHIRETQIVQTRLDEIVLRVVRAAGYSDADEKTVRAEARQRLGDSVHVRFEYVPAIERTAAGKSQLVVSDLKNVESDRNRRPMSPIKPALEHRSILGIRVDATDYSDAAGRVLAWAKAGESRYVCVTNVHVVMEAHDSAEYFRMINDGDLVTPDGMPLVWALRLLGVRGATRVDGSTLTYHVCWAAARDGAPVALYGATDETLAAFTAFARREFPGIQIVAALSPPYRPATTEEDAADVERLIHSGARIVLVALGCPKQERWIAQHRGRIPSVMLGIGAALDFHVGRVARAPRWMQKTGLEWLFRLMMEPRRLWRRYARHNPRFLMLFLLQLLGRRQFTPRSSS